MSGILLVGPAGRGDPAQSERRVRIQRAASLDGAGDAPWSAIVVINDHTAGAVERLRAALELRRQHPGLRIAVMTYVPWPDPGHVVDALIRSLSSAGTEAVLPFDQAAALLAGEQLPVRAHLADEGITFEYQV